MKIGIYSFVESKHLNKIASDSATIAQLSGRIRLMYENSQFKVDKETLLMKENGDTFKLTNMAFDYYLFVIRFSEFSSAFCITSEMEKIAQFAQLHKNTLCLGTYTYLNDLVILSAQHVL